MGKYFRFPSPISESFGVFAYDINTQPPAGAK